MEYDEENPTTRTRMILEQMRRLEEERRVADAARHEQIEKQVKAVADSIDAFRSEMNERETAKADWMVRLWVWAKKVLSFAHSEAEKIRLDDR